MANKNNPLDPDFSEGLVKAIQRRIADYENQLLEMRKKEVSSSLSEVSVEDVEKSAPPEFSEETMHKLKAKYGTESAFKIAWAAHNKNKGKKSEKEMSKNESPAQKLHKALAKKIEELKKHEKEGPALCKSCQKPMNAIEVLLHGGAEHKFHSVAKQEDWIDLAHDTEKSKRLKEKDAPKDRKLPGDKPEETVAAPGSGGDVKANPVKKEEATETSQSSSEESSKDMEKAVPMSGMGKMPVEAQHAAAHDSHKDAMAAKPEAAPKAVPKSPSEYDAAAFQPPPAASKPPAGFKSPVKVHLDKLKGAANAPKPKLPMAGLSNVVGKKPGKA